MEINNTAAATAAVAGAGHKVDEYFNDPCHEKNTKRPAARLFQFLFPKHQTQKENRKTSVFVLVLLRNKKKTLIIKTERKSLCRHEKTKIGWPVVNDSLRNRKNTIFSFSFLSKTKLVV